MVATWMKDHASTQWSTGIKFVQFMKNRSLHAGIKRSPYQAMFGSEPRVGIESGNLPVNVLQNHHDIMSENEFKDIFKSINSEAVLDEQIPKDAVIESNKKKNFICVYCNKNCDDEFICFNCSLYSHGWSCKVSEEEVIKCHFCCNEEKIHEERKAAEAGLQQQAKRMKLLSEKCFGEFSVGTAVSVPIPNQGRGKSDSRSILGVT